MRYRTVAPCPRLINDDTGNAITALAYTFLTHDEARHYGPCEGHIAIHVTDDPGRLSGPPEDCYPPEYDAEVQSCDICESDDWTDTEEAEMQRTAKPSNDDDGYDDDD